MALADTRIRSLETARECVRLGARQRTIAWLTGLPTSFIFHNIYDASVEYGVPGNLLDGANIAGFRKVADAMLAQGVC